MKNLILFIAILSINLSFSQSREKEFLVRLQEKEFAKQNEQENLNLLMEIYQSINTLQAMRKFHYEKRYDKEYLKQYKKKLLYGLYEEKSWDKDRIKMEDYLRNNISLYYEQYQRCSFYTWIRQFPVDIKKFLKVDDLLNKY